jgi:hypothetical protein
VPRTRRDGRSGAPTTGCDGALQKAELTLFRGDVRSDTPGVIEQGEKGEVLPAIAAKVGLSLNSSHVRRRNVSGLAGTHAWPCVADF